MNGTDTPEDGESARTVTVDPGLELCAHWINEHGDPADWCPATWDAYENTVLHAAAGGAL